MLKERLVTFCLVPMSIVLHLLVFTMRRLVEIQFVTLSTNFWTLVSASTREGSEQSNEMSSAYKVTFPCEICDGKSLTYMLKRTGPQMVH